MANMLEHRTSINIKNFGSPIIWIANDTAGFRLHVHESILHDISLYIELALMDNGTGSYGEPGSEFLHHQSSKLIQKSGYPKEELFVFGEETNATLEHFVSWLYTGHFLRDDPKDPTIKRPSLMVASRIWLFANRIKNSNLANDAMNACYNAVSGSPISLYTESWATFVYENTKPGSKLREFTAKAYAIRMDTSICFARGNKGLKYPQEFLVDVFASFPKGLQVDLFGRPTTSPPSQQLRLKRWRKIDMTSLYVPRFDEEDELFGLLAPDSADEMSLDGSDGESEVSKRSDD